MRIVDAENSHALRAQNRTTSRKREPDIWISIAIKSKIDDVFVLLRRVLRILDRPIGSALKPFGMFIQPRMIRRTLPSDIHRNLDAICIGLANKSAKVFNRTQFRVNCVMSALCGPDRVNAARIADFGAKRIVSTLTVRTPNRMKRWKVKDIETHVAYVGNTTYDVRKCAVALRISSLQSGETIRTMKRRLRAHDQQ